MFAGFEHGPKSLAIISTLIEFAKLKCTGGQACLLMSSVELQITKSPVLMNSRIGVTLANYFVRPGSVCSTLLHPLSAFYRTDRKLFLLVLYYDRFLMEPEKKRGRLSK